MVIGPVPDQVPTFAEMVLPATTVVGLKLGAPVLLGAILIGPKDEEYVVEVPAPILLVDVATVTLATKYFPTMVLVRFTDAVVTFTTVQPVGATLPDWLAAGQKYHW